MLFKALFLVLPAVVFARINVRMKTSQNEQNVDINYVGSNIEIISDQERETFGIGDENLKDAVKAFSGIRPADVFVRSPTPWDDLYTKYGWNQVQRTLFPYSATVLGIHSEPVIVATQEFINNSSVTATYNTGITQSIQQTVSNMWSKKFELTVGQEISYGVDFEVGEIGGSTSLSFESSWGEEVTKSQSVTVGSSNGVSVELKPGQHVVASITASRGTLEIQVEYRATLSGAVACNYPNKYHDHHFWGHDINEVLEAANMDTVKTSWETIKIGFYTDAKLVVSDPQ